MKFFDKIDKPLIFLSVSLKSDISIVFIPGRILDSDFHIYNVLIYTDV